MFVLSKPNYKARLHRATRNNVPVYSVSESFKKSKFFVWFLIIIFPIYPSLAAIWTVSETTIGDYDESSILASFVDTENLEYISETGLVTGDTNSWSSWVSEESVNIQNSNQEIPKSNIRTYTVVEYDDIIKISKKYNISAEVILWSNNLSMNDTLKVGQVLKIPEKSWVVHILKRWETVSSLSKEYNVSVAEILEYNNISDATKIKDGTKLLIPGAVKKEVIPVVNSTKNTDNVTKVATKTTEQKIKSIPTTQPEKLPVTQENVTKNIEALNNGLKERYDIKFTGLWRWFVAGNCTWHVARNKKVTWRGNANQWIKNARAQWVPTGKIPVIGAIVQFSGYGYNSYYWHVGIVTDMTDTHIIVSDMNYAWLYKVTIRKVAKNDPAIDWYIYVD